jgi:hypothetical protein
VFVGFFGWAVSQDLAFSSIVGVGVALILEMGWAVYELRYWLMLNMVWVSGKPISHHVDSPNEHK